MRGRDPTIPPPLALRVLVPSSSPLSGGADGALAPVERGALVFRGLRTRKGEDSAGDDELTDSAPHDFAERVARKVGEDRDDAGECVVGDRPFGPEAHLLEADRLGALFEDERGDDVLLLIARGDADDGDVLDSDGAQRISPEVLIDFPQVAGLG